MHGRGGQGAKTMAMLLAEASIESDKFAIAFPEFGPERTGAPVRSYLRVDSDEILTREPIQKADLVIVLDDTLLKEDSVIKTISHNPDLLVNSSKEEEEIKKMMGDSIDFQKRINIIDAYALVKEAKQRVHFSAPIFGMLFRIKEFIALDEFSKVYKQKFEKKLGKEVIDETIDVMEKAYDKL